MTSRSTVDHHFSVFTFFLRLGDFLKSRIDIFAAEKPKLRFYGIKTYAEYSSFLNRSHYIFTDWMPTENRENMVTAEKWRSTVFIIMTVI